MNVVILDPGRCYKVNWEKLSWVQALLECKSQGGLLATQYSTEEYDFVYGKITVYQLFHKNVNLVRKQNL